MPEHPEKYGQPGTPPADHPLTTGTLAPGTVVDRVQFAVERGKIREFATASQAADPVHTSAAAAARRGLPDVAATATHVVVSGHQRDQQQMLATLGLDINRVVVGGTGWSYHRPLTAGDELTGTRRLVSDEVKTSRSGRSLRIVRLNTEFTLTDGTVAVSQRETLIERGN